MPSLQRWEVGAATPNVRDGSCHCGCRSYHSRRGRWELPLRRCWRWELYRPSSSGRWEPPLQVQKVGVPQSNYKITQHKLMFQSPRSVPELVLNIKTSAVRHGSLLVRSAPRRTVNTLFIQTLGRSDTAGHAYCTATLNVCGYNSCIRAVSYTHLTLPTILRV